MSVIRSYRDLKAWQRSFELGMRLYDVTSDFPSHERFGLSSQLRRGGVSVPSDICEGFGRGSRRDYLRFLRMARGALYEIDTQLLFSLRLGYLDAETHRSIEKDMDDCGRLLAGLIRSVSTSDKSTPGS